MDSKLTHTNELDELEVAEEYVCPIEEMINHIKVNNDDLTIISQNICSIYSNLDDFLTTLTRLQTKVDIIILTECKLNPCKPIPQICNYTGHYTTKHVNKCDGVVVYVKHCLVNDTTEIILNGASCLQIRIDNITILGIYRSPSKINASGFIDSLDKHLGTISSANNIVITGDININLILKDEEHPQVSLNRTN
ncbi:unnamed protein product [Euphydryas editha]|uniref:Uncharacterized protein n=1 Tax=Euphydryas editha TaxID=104508 RepID=A0AAU9TZT5_EUPED|nr:unnamed protein product [Euphydryas editha]